jgi:hypothetical protein
VNELTLPSGDWATALPPLIADSHTPTLIAASIRPRRGRAHRCDRLHDGHWLARPRPDRIGAAIGMRVEDVYTQNRRLWVRLHDKGGKQHAMPRHHNLETYLHAYIDGAGFASDAKALLLQTYSRATGQLTGNPLPQAKRLRDDSTAREIRRHHDAHGQPYVSGDGRDGVSEKWRHPRTSRADGEPCLDQDDAALRPPRRGGDARRGGEDTCMTRQKGETYRSIGRNWLRNCTANRRTG